MKKNLAPIFIALIILGTGAGILVPKIASAQAAAVPPAPAQTPGALGKLANGVASVAATALLPTTSWANTTLAYVSNAMLTVTSVFVTATAAFLSISINLTMHIKDIYEKINGIRLVWTVVRDLSSLVIILALLYFSILTIVGAGKGKVGKLIVNIFIAGVFINFSLFFVKVAIDASNLVSLQFYDAIAPQTQTNWTVDSAYYDGGLSNVLLNSLKVQKVYSTASTLGGLDVAGGLLFATIGGIIIMITTAFSFLAASIAFVARTGILLFMLAVSPIFFVGIIFPDIKNSVSGPLLKVLKKQLIFMPVYLALMYVALRILSDPSFNSIFNQTSTGTLRNTPYAYVWTSIIIQYTIAIIFINIPLLAAISLGGYGMKWAPTARSVAGRVSGIIGRNTVGRISKGLGKSYDNMAANGTFLGSSLAFKVGAKLAQKTNVATATRGVLTSGEKSKYGGKYSLSDIEKEEKERTKAVAKIKRENRVEDDMDAVMGTNAKPSDKQKEDFAKTVTKLSKTEVESADKDKLRNPVFLRTLTSKQFDGLMESQIDDDLKEELKDKRKEALKEHIGELSDGGDKKATKEFIKNLTGKELKGLGGEIVTKGEVIDVLTTGQLNDMAENDLEKDFKNKIYDHIRASGSDPTTQHDAFNWIEQRVNKVKWK